jgi:hypothetical protein
MRVLVWIKEDPIFFIKFLEELQQLLQFFLTILSRTHFLTEFDLHLVDLTFIPKVHRGVQRGLKSINESFYRIITPKLLVEVLGELQRPTAIHTNVSKTESLLGFGIFLDDRDLYRFRLPGHCGIFTAEMCAIHFGCDSIESKPMDAYIILTDSFFPLRD